MILKLHKCLPEACPKDSHVWEYKRLTLQELLTVQETLGLEPAEFEEALGSTATGVTSTGARAVIMLVNLMHRRDGIVLAYADTDLDITELEVIPDPAPAGPSEVEQDAAGAGGGKDDAPTPNPSPRHDAPEAASGNGNAAVSEPRSSTTPATSGAATGSP